jgi:hypothetical protein
MAENIAVFDGTVWMRRLRDAALWTKTTSRSMARSTSSQRFKPTSGNVDVQIDIGGA